jgi:hypothetical protein
MHALIKLRQGIPPAAGDLFKRARLSKLFQVLLDRMTQIEYHESRRESHHKINRHDSAIAINASRSRRWHSL